MSEKYIMFQGITPLEKKLHANVALPELKTVEDLKEEEKFPFGIRAYSSSEQTVNKFLSEKFGYDIAGFRKLYAEKYAPMLHMTPEQLLKLGQIHAITPQIYVFLMEINSVPEFKIRIHTLREITELYTSTGPLNLHSNNICNFTLIRAKFDLSQVNGFYGFYGETDTFRYLINSSNQFDIILVYEDF